MMDSPPRAARRVLAAALLLVALLAAPATAQAPPPVSNDSRAVKTQLDAAKAELDQHRAALARPTLATQDLQAIKSRIDPVADRLRDLVGDVTPKLDGAKARLDQLGPKPKEGSEGAETARDRAEREAAVAELDEVARLTRALLLEAEQLGADVTDRRRSLFTRALFERNAGLLGSGLWSPAAGSLWSDLAAMRTVLSDIGGRFVRDISPVNLTLIALALGIALALHVGRKRLAPRLIHRDPAVVDPPRRRLLGSALVVLLVEAVPAAAGSFLIYGVLDASGFLPPRVMPAVGSALAGLAFVAFVRGLGHALLAPDRSGWRVARLGDASAADIYGFALTGATILAASKFVEALYATIAAGLPLTVLTRAIFALAFALVLGELLRRLATREPTEDACLGPYIPTSPEVGGPVRMLGWIVVGAVIAATLSGYVAFASFLVDQFAWTSILAALLMFAIALVDGFVGSGLAGHSRLSTSLQANTGLRQGSLRQIGVLLNGFARVALVLSALMLALAPWGVESTDVLSSVRAAFFGFKVGDVTISLSTLIFAILIFGLCFLATRLIQRWLEGTFLPTTELDAGLRNSIVTAFGYLGFFAAAAFSFSYLGLGLDRIAIVAGALSVGIGFGLQSVVNNFVSGLILLWERPIRVGDLIVVGEGEGHVRRISVRATEIETFDRSTVIVPNSNLISGVVRNRVRSDRSGRIVTPVNVLRNQDPNRAAQLLTSCASAHPDILKEPAPHVFFKKIGDSNLEFELVCFVADINNLGRVQSELNFAIFEAMTSGGLIPPLGPGATTVLGLGPVENALHHIAEALEQDEDVAAAPAESVEERAAAPERKRGASGSRT